MIDVSDFVVLTKENCGCHSVHLSFNEVKSCDHNSNLCVVALLISHSCLRTVRVNFGGGGVSGSRHACTQRELVDGNVEHSFLGDWDTDNLTLHVRFGDVSDASDLINDGLVPFVLSVFTVSYQVEAIGDNVVVSGF
jgi:hypothetical protein